MSFDVTSFDFEKKYLFEVVWLLVLHANKVENKFKSTSALGKMILTDNKQFNDTNIKPVESEVV